MLSRLTVTASAVAAFVVVMAVLLVLQPGGAGVAAALSDLVQLALAAAAALSTGWLARGLTGRMRAVWAAVAIGCGGWAVGEAIWSWFELVLGRETPFPSMADLGFLLFPVGASIGVWLHPRHGTRSERGRSILDALTVAAALGLISWTTALGAVARESSDSPLAFVVSLSYPVLDLIVLTLAFVVLSRNAGSRTSLIGIVLGVAGIACADSAFVFFTSTGSYETGGVIDLGWMAGFAVLAVTPLWHRTQSLVSEAPAVVRSWRGASQIPVLLATLAVGVELFGGRGFDTTAQVLVATVVLLVLARQSSMVREATQLLAALSDREEQLLHQAFHDPLTGLANRALFQDRLEHALHLHLRDLRGLAVIFLDLDDFKLVNDSLGHAAGDDLLVRLGERLQGALRNGDTLARMGGDEFAVLLEDVDDVEDAWTVGAKLFEATSKPFLLHGTPVSVQISVGLTAVARDAASPTASAVLAQADTAMYAAKRARKGSAQAFTPDMRSAEPSDGPPRRPAPLDPAVSPDASDAVVLPDS